MIAAKVEETIEWSKAELLLDTNVIEKNKNYPYKIVLRLKMQKLFTQESRLRFLYSKFQTVPVKHVQ